MNAVVYFFTRTLFPVFASVALLACSEEKSEPLPDLAPVEIPKEIMGLYSGRMPCDDCTSRMVRMSLAENHSVEAVQLTLRDTIETDTLRGTYSVTDSSIGVSLSGNRVHWKFKRIKFGNLRYMTSAGVPYEDKDGLHADLIKIYKPVAKIDPPKNLVPDVDNPQGAKKTAESKE